MKAKTKKPPEAESHDYIHTFGYGDPGSEKSTFAASFPYPMVVWFTDGLGKEAPYLRRFVDRLGCRRKKWKGEEGQRILSLMQGETELCRIEYYHNINPEIDCQAYNRLHTRMQRFAAEREYQNWSTGVLDSSTGFCDIAGENQEFSVNPGSADDKQLRWAANITNNAATILKGLSFMPINIVILGHIQAQKVKLKVGRDAAPSSPLETGMTEYQDVFMRTIALPGRLGRNIALVAGKFPEFYRFYIDNDGKAKIQTKSRDEWVALSQIPAPDGVAPRYANLWKTTAKQRGGEKDAESES